MSASEPLVSVGMPVRNCERTIDYAIRSILHQTYDSWELLLVDDGSSDRTLDVAQRYCDSRIKVRSDGKRLGLPTRLNEIISLSQGDYFARMDGDDISYPDRLRLQSTYLSSHPSVDLVAAHMVVFGAGGRVLGCRKGPEPHNAIAARAEFGFPMAHPTFMGRIGFFQKFGYRPQAIRAEDQDLLFRSYEDSTFAIVPEILLGYREDKIRLAQILHGRHSYTRSVLEALAGKRQFFAAVKVLSVQALKAIADCVAVGFRLDHRLLRNRARPVSTEEAERWQAVWRDVTCGTKP